MKRWASRQNLVQDRAQRENIAPSVESRAQHRMLRREIIGCAHNLAWACHSPAVTLQVLRQAEIENLRLQFCAHQNVCGFQVAVQNLVRMQKIHGQRHFLQQFRFLPQRQGTPRLDQGTAFYQFHHEMWRLFRLAQTEDPNNVWMAELRQRARLLHEPRAHRLVVPVSPIQRLDRHLSTQPLVEAQQNAAHAPRPNLTENLVAGERVRRFFSLFLRWPGREGGRRSVHLRQRFQQRPQFLLQFRGGLAERIDVHGFFARQAIHVRCQRFRDGALFLRSFLRPALWTVSWVFIPHGYPVVASISRKRFNARCSKTATLSRDFPTRSEISFVVSPSNFASIIISRYSAGSASSFLSRFFVVSSRANNRLGVSGSTGSGPVGLLSERNRSSSSARRFSRFWKRAASTITWSAIRES